MQDYICERCGSDTVHLSISKLLDCYSARLCVACINQWELECCTDGNEAGRLWREVSLLRIKVKQAYEHGTPESELQELVTQVQKLSLEAFNYGLSWVKSGKKTIEEKNNE